MVEGDNLGNVVEADAEAFNVVDVAGGDAVEFFEDVFLVFFGDADAVVGDFDDGVTVDDGGRDLEEKFVGGVLDGVVDEVV